MRISNQVLNKEKKSLLIIVKKNIVSYHKIKTIIYEDWNNDNFRDFEGNFVKTGEYV